MDFVKVVEKLRDQFSGQQEVPTRPDVLLEQAGLAAQSCLRCLRQEAFPVKIGKALESLGFELWVRDFADNNISGVMAINADEDFLMVIGVNANDRYEHQRFTLAHKFLYSGVYGIT